MNKAKRRNAGRVELGRCIVADRAICHGKPTFRGTRVFVADVLADVERGLSWDFILHRWGGGKISKAAVTDAVHLARVALLETGRFAAVRAGILGLIIAGALATFALGSSLC